ncbi:unnamed protein product [Urochloa humidicola]
MIFQWDIYIFVPLVNVLSSKGLLDYLSCYSIETCPYISVSLHGYLLEDHIDLNI